jgi:predicted RND superfamily exporter protein
VTAVLRRLATAVERRPGLALVALFVLTVVLGGLATQQQTDSDMTAFAPESDLHAANERITQEFSGT